MESDKSELLNVCSRIFFEHRSKKEGAPYNLSDDKKASLIALLDTVGMVVQNIEEADKEDIAANPRRYPRDISFPFLAWNEGAVNMIASCWLNLAYKCAVRPPNPDGNATKALVELVSMTLPMNPIVLTPKGDLLIEDVRKLKAVESLGGYYLEDLRTRDRHEIPFKKAVGIHEGCAGKVILHHAPGDKDILACLNCFLRVEVSPHIHTYGELRAALMPAPLNDNGREDDAVALDDEEIMELTPIPMVSR